jgi:hypothetical protein
VPQAGGGEWRDLARLDEFGQRGLADPYVPTDLDELDAPLGNQSADKPRGSA